MVPAGSPSGSFSPRPPATTSPRKGVFSDASPRLKATLAAARAGESVKQAKAKRPQSARVTEYSVFGDASPALKAALAAAEKRPQSARLAEPPESGDISPWPQSARASPPPLPAGSSAAAGSGISPPRPESARAAGSSAAGSGISAWRSIADIAKPTLKMRKSARLGYAVDMPTSARAGLDGALKEAKEARRHAKHAMSDTELKLGKLYERDHDEMIVARALLTGTTNAIVKMMSTLEALEGEAALARAKSVADAKELVATGNASISQLHAEREAILALLAGELYTIDHDTSFSIATLLERIRQTGVDNAAELARLDEKVEGLDAAIAESKRKRHEQAKAASAESVRLSSEIARLCGAIEKLKSDAKSAEHQAEQAHASVVGAMSEQMLERQREIRSREMEAAETRRAKKEAALDLKARMKRAAAEKEVQEKRLRDDKARLAEQSRLAAMKANSQLAALEAEKEAQTSKLSAELEQEMAEKAAEQAALKAKIEKMRKLQELALGGARSKEEQSRQPTREGRGPSSRGRQLLYWESLKSKARETPSMSWRGANEWAEDQPSGHAEAARQAHETKGHKADDVGRRAAERRAGKKAAGGAR